MSQATDDQKKRINSLREEYSSSIDEFVCDAGMGLNPSLNGMLLYGDMFVLSDYAKGILEENARLHEEMYARAVVPRIPQLLQALLQDRTIDFDVYEPEHWNIDTYRRILAEEYFKPANGYTRAKKLENKITDAATLNTLKSSDPLPRANYRFEDTNIFPDLRHGRIFSYRPKEVGKLSEKQRRKIAKVIRLDQTQEGLIETAYEFISEATFHPSNYWVPEVRTNFLHYPRTVRSLLVGDNLGIRAIINKRAEAKAVQDSILNKKGLSHLGFNIIYERVEDHRKRRLKSRPGGIHLTATDKGMNLPVEVQVLDIVDAINDALGPEAHWRYKEQKRKKLNSNS